MTKENQLRQRWNGKKILCILYTILCAIAVVFFIHPDTMETTNHSYLLIDAIFDGDFLGYYERIAVHNNTLYYINGAHYSILFYLVFALWELPLYLINTIFSLTPNEPLIWIWGKTLSMVFFILSAQLIGKLASGVGEDGDRARWMMLLHPVPFFFAVMMGQYDSLCVFFMLLTLNYYQKKDMLRFSLWMGVAALFKMFALLAFIPLLLLSEKKLWNLVKYGAIGLIPYLINTVLFWGRTGNAAYFTSEMLKRLFAIEIGSVPAFGLFYVLLLVWCWLRPTPEEKRERLLFSSGVCMAVYLLMIVWGWIHPQWAYLPVAFWILCVMLQKNRTLYPYTTIAFSVGVTLFAWRIYPGQFEINTLFYGILDLLNQNDTLVNLNYTPFVQYIGYYALIEILAKVLMLSAAAAILLTRFPLQKCSWADQYVEKKEELPLSLLWLCFVLCIGFWLGATLLNMIRFLAFV